jgi:hypothetical protein
MSIPHVLTRAMAAAACAALLLGAVPSAPFASSPSPPPCLPRSGPSPQEASPASEAGAPAVHFGLMEAQVDYPETANLGIEMVRRFVSWGEVQSGPGEPWNWQALDDQVSVMQSYGFDILFVLLPFAPWDQQACHSPGTTEGPPCDSAGYASFARAIVERYDGDGADDMPGLAKGVRSWEILNEPSLGQLTPADYTALLETSYPVIREACSRCTVLEGGVAGMYPNVVPYVQTCLALGAANHFDVANIHFIHTDEFEETLFVQGYLEFLASQGVSKPLWVSEAQIQNGPGSVLGEERGASEIVKAYVRAFGLGAQRIVYTIIKEHPGFPGYMNQAALIDLSGHRRPAFFAVQTMIAQLKGFRSVVTLAPGQYRFKLKKGKVYALWGTGPIPSEIRGTVRVTDIRGSSSVMSASQVVLSDEPVFVRKAN